MTDNDLEAFEREVTATRKILKTLTALDPAVRGEIMRRVLLYLDAYVAHDREVITVDPLAPDE